MSRANNRTKKYACLYNQKIIANDTDFVSGQSHSLLFNTPHPREHNRFDGNTVARKSGYGQGRL